MSVMRSREIPAALRSNLAAFRARVRKLKMLEVSLLASLGLLLSYLLVFGLDRLFDTPPWLRALLLLGGAVGLVVLLPYQLFRWVLRTSTPSQVARVVARKDAATGDRLLGVIELTSSDAEYGRSPVLCEAAIHQVDEDLHGKDYSNALPSSRHRTWGRAVLAPLAASLAVFALVPSAGFNAAARWLAPFGATPRYTFARVEAMPASIVVAKGEEAKLVVVLTKDSSWQPAQGSVRCAGQKELVADLAGGSYSFQLPALTRTETLDLRIGDFHHALEVVPVDRPGIAALEASIRLPDYLGIQKPRQMDGRAGVLGVVKGSRVTLAAEATRELTAVRANAQQLAVEGRKFQVPEILAEKAQELQLQWTDVHGLQGQQPMTVALRVHDDGTPTVHCEGLRHETVLLVSDTLVFKVNTQDDFGVRRVGLWWEGIPDPFMNPKPKKGEKVLVTPENAETEKLTAEAAFCPELLGIAAQPLKVGAWVEDAYPGRERVTTTPITVFVMTPEEHMIWLTKQLTAWNDDAREVHERELALYDTNLALRALSREELNRDGNRRKLENQARSERANAQRLGALINSGQSLLGQAARNPEFNASTLDQWAETMRALQDIASSRMPSVANLLAGAAQSKSAGPVAGVDRLGPRNSGGPPVQNINKLPANPSVVDNESTQMENKDAPSGSKGQKKVNAAPPPLRLASTVLAGKTCSTGEEEAGDQPDREPVDNMTAEELAKAIEEQRKLLEEFARLQGDISRVVAALTGSTFVKRLKSESREQGVITGVIRSDLLQEFGQRLPATKNAKERAPAGSVLEAVVGRENRASNQVSLIQEDLGAFVDRLEGQEEQKKFKTVLDEMRVASPAVEIAEVGVDMESNLKGEAVVGTEFWADKLDYWAELLVGPG